jgi:hypothetical protein
VIQIAYLEQWPALEKENSLSLFRASEALKASTLRLPVTSGARVCCEKTALIKLGIRLHCYLCPNIAFAIVTNGIAIVLTGGHS